MEPLVGDTYKALPVNSARLSGHLERAIQKVIAKWTKKKCPYNAFADFFSEGRPCFAAGELWGKAVRSASQFYKYTADPELKDMLDQAVRYMLLKQQENGSISCTKSNEQPDSNGGDLWERKYVLLGLDGYYEYVNSDPGILDSMIRQVDCLISQIGKHPKVSIVDLGWSPNHIESSTLLEPIMRLYFRTGFKRFLEFASYIIEQGGTNGYNLIEQSCDNVDPLRMGGEYSKAYEMLSFFEGLVEYYRATGDRRIKKAILNFYENVRNKEITIIGNGGADAPYHTHGECWDNTAYEQTNPAITRMMETCVGVTWLKFCHQILRLTGDPSAVDEMERAIYNFLTGAMKPSGDRFSYMNLLNGVRTNPEGWGVWIPAHGGFTCCDLNGPMGLAYIPHVAVMNSSNGPIINLYNEGEFTLHSPQGQKITIELKTDYPASGRITIKLRLETQETFDLQLRIPSWSITTSYRLDDRVYTARAGSYSTLNNDWHDGDTVTLDLDMRCRLLDSPKGDNFQALIRGPIVLARDENMDSTYAEPVTVVSHNGYVDVDLEKPYYDSVWLQFKVPTTDGIIRMINYSSSDNWNGRNTYTWLPKRA